MLNTNIKLGSNSQNVTFNQVSTGMMQRSNPNSIFIRFHKNSELAKRVFPHDGRNPYIKSFDHYTEEYNRYKDTRGRLEVIVLQILIFGQDEFLCEVLDTKFIQTSSNTEE